jgi:hypothetical protein
MSEDHARSRIDIRPVDWPALPFCHVETAELLNISHRRKQILIKKLEKI